MPYIAIVVALLVLSMPTLAAAPASVRFIGSVQEQDSTPVRFDIHIPAGQKARLQLASFNVAFATAGSAGNADQTTVLLERSSGEKLHGQSIPGTGLASTSFLYLICNGQARFISPAPEQPESCARGEP
jgi:hypothetical protein